MLVEAAFIFWQYLRRHAAASYHDLVLSAGTLLLLTLVSPLLILEDDHSSSLLSFVLAVLIAALPAITALALAWMLWRLVRRDAWRGIGPQWVSNARKHVFDSNV